MHRRSVIVMGVSGVGKTSVAEGLADRLHGTYLEADALHPPENIKSMQNGTPLTDEMRLPWLANVAAAIKSEQDKDATKPVFAACSALKRTYRDLIREILPEVVFLHLTASEALISTRIGAREGHFMPPSLLQSQLATLERPEANEAHVSIDVSGDKDAVVSAAISALRPL